MPLPFVEFRNEDRRIGGILGAAATRTQVRLNFERILYSLNESSNFIDIKHVCIVRANYCKRTNKTKKRKRGKKKKGNDESYRDSLKSCVSASGSRALYIGNYLRIFILRQPKREAM